MASFIVSLGVVKLKKFDVIKYLFDLSLCKLFGGFKYRRRSYDQIDLVYPKIDIKINAYR